MQKTFLTFISSSSTLHEAASITTTAVPKNPRIQHLAKMKMVMKVPMETATAADVEVGDPAASSSFSFNPKAY